MSTLTLQSKNTATIANSLETGAPWKYNQSLMTYNSSIFEMKPVKYNSVGAVSSYSLQSKNTATIANQTKN